MGNNLKNTNLASLTPSQGLSITPAISYDTSRRSLSNAGDINQDGHDDIIIGDPPTSAVYVLFGTSNGFVNMKQGFTIFAKKGDRTGWSVSSAKDFNGDGYPDVIISALSANNGRGAAYIIWGKKSGFTNIDLNNLNPTQGISITAPSNVFYFGASVAGIGDTNGDGFDDVAISSNQDGYNIVHVIFGSNSTDNINTGSLKLEQSFIIKDFTTIGTDFLHLSYSVSAAGDVNGDGHADILMGSIHLSYLIYGAEFSNNIQLNKIGTRGITITGGGVVVSYIGDINNDGYDDVMIGNNYDDNKGSNTKSYVVSIPKKFTSTPISFPTSEPSSRPSSLPSSQPSEQPSSHPTHPTFIPSFTPTSPTSQPTAAPSQPTHPPTLIPTSPTITPTAKPTLIPTFTHTHAPSKIYTLKPTEIPTLLPNAMPTDYPTIELTENPSTAIIPTLNPTLASTDPLSTLSIEITPTDKGITPTALIAGMSVAGIVFLGVSYYLAFVLRYNPFKLNTIVPTPEKIKSDLTAKTPSPLGSFDQADESVEIVINPHSPRLEWPKAEEERMASFIEDGDFSDCDSDMISELGDTNSYYDLETGFITWS